MDIDRLLKQLPWDKQMYFRWKFDLFFDKTKEKKSEEEFLKLVNKKTLNPFLRWERGDEYASLVKIYMGMKVQSDWEKVYNKILDQALDGDLQAQKEIYKLKGAMEKEARELLNYALEKIDDDEPDETEEE